MSRNPVVVFSSVCVSLCADASASLRFMSEGSQLKNRLFIVPLSTPVLCGKFEEVRGTLDPATNSRKAGLAPDWKQDSSVSLQIWDAHIGKAAVIYKIKHGK